MTRDSATQPTAQESPRGLPQKAAQDAPLRLLAMDAEDLMVLSAHLQDTEILGSDIGWRPRERRFALVGRRLDRMCGLQEIRRLTGFHLDRVIAVRQQGFAAEWPKTPLSLQCVMFRPGEAPGGAVVLTFDGGAAIRVEVECIEAALQDLDGPAELPPDCAP